jgi:hypothetical protein
MSWSSTGLQRSLLSWLGCRCSKELRKIWSWTIFCAYFQLIPVGSVLSLDLHCTELYVLKLWGSPFNFPREGLWLSSCLKYFLANGVPSVGRKEADRQLLYKLHLTLLALCYFLANSCPLVHWSFSVCSWWIVSLAHGRQELCYWGTSPALHLPASSLHSTPGTSEP